MRQGEKTTGVASCDKSSVSAGEARKPRYAGSSRAELLLMAKGVSSQPDTGACMAELSETSRLVVDGPDAAGGGVIRRAARRAM